MGRTMTALVSLKGIEVVQALQRIAHAIQELLPSPTAPGDGPQDGELIGEVLRRLRHEEAPWPLPPTPRADSLALLTDALLEYGKREFDLRAAKARLGKAARLPLGDYEVRWSEHFGGPGVTRRNVEAAI